jgi:hypothetical protein
MFKRIGQLLLVAILVALSGQSAYAFSGTGAGTVGDPHVVTTCQQLFEIQSNLGGSYVLDGDIDCTGVTWAHIGTLGGVGFSGTLDGQGYAIQNLTVNDTNGVGLFTYIDGGTISNLVINNFDVTGTGTVGSLAARADNATIRWVRVEDSVVYSEYATGGMFGILDNSIVRDSSVHATDVRGRSGASMSQSLGGFVGLSSNNVYHRVSSGGAVDAIVPSSFTIENTGGFVGYAMADVWYDAYSTADASGVMQVGGFVGDSTSSVFYRTYASGDAVGNSHVGGFSGQSALSLVADSFASGNVVGNTMTGGLIGRVQAIGGDVLNSTWDLARTDVSTCVGADQGISYATVCLAGVNGGSSEPNYFFSNAVNTPLGAWDFDTVWQTTATLPLLRTAPSRPDTVTVVPSAQSLLVRWQVPATTGGGVINTYDIKLRPMGSTAARTVVSGIPANGSLQHTFAGLAPNTTYEIEIRANSSVGSGTWIGFIASTTALVSLTQPTPTAAATKVALGVYAPSTVDATTSSESMSGGDVEGLLSAVTINPQVPLATTPAEKMDEPASNNVAFLVIATIVVLVVTGIVLTVRRTVRL